MAKQPKIEPPETLEGDPAAEMLIKYGDFPNRKERAEILGNTIPKEAE